MGVSMYVHTRNDPGPIPALDIHGHSVFDVIFLTRLIETFAVSFEAPDSLREPSVTPVLE